MKKTSLILLSLIMVFFLVACGEEKSAITTGEEIVPPAEVSFPDGIWCAYMQVNSDGYGEIPSGNPKLLSAEYLEPVEGNGTLKVYSYSFMNEPSLAGLVDRSIEYNGNTYYFCGSVQSGDSHRYTVDGDKITVTTGEKVWLVLKRRSVTEYEVLSCEKGVKADLPIGLVFTAQPS